MIKELFKKEYTEKEVLLKLRDTFCKYYLSKQDGKLNDEVIPTIIKLCLVFSSSTILTALSMAKGNKLVTQEDLDKILPGLLSEFEEIMTYSVKGLENAS